MEPRKRIVVVTKLKNVPSFCRECPFTYQALSGKECYFTMKSIPLNYEELQRNGDCPLRVIELKEVNK